jgi:hypothetical protein
MVILQIQHEMFFCQKYHMKIKNRTIYRYITAQLHASEQFDLMSVCLHQCFLPTCLIYRLQLDGDEHSINHMMRFQAQQ